MSRGFSNAAPDNPAELWPWLREQEQVILLELLACVVAASVDAIRYRHEKRMPPRVTNSQRLAQAVDLDMAKYWTADAGFLSRLPKSTILAIIAEAISPEVARGLDRGSKLDVVAAAGRKLAGSKWLPSVLRTSIFSVAQEIINQDDIEIMGNDAAESHYAVE